MAVPGADRRKSIDGHQTEGVVATAPVRSELGGLSPAFDSDGSPGDGGVTAAGVRPSADNTGKRDVQDLNAIAETDGGFTPEPPAIEVVAGQTVVAERSGGASTRSSTSDGRFGETGSYLHYLEPDPRARRAVIVE